MKITFGEMRAAGTISILVYSADYKCSPSIAMAADRRGDDVHCGALMGVERLLPCLITMTSFLRSDDGGATNK